MITRRHLLVAAGVSVLGGAGMVYEAMNPPVEATGSSESGTLCHAPAQTPPDGTLSIYGVRVDETTVSVAYDIVSDRPVETVVITVDGEVVASRPWNGDKAELDFSHDGPVTFELQARSKDGRVLDSAEILAECGPAEELTG